MESPNLNNRTSQAILCIAAIAFAIPLFITLLAGVDYSGESLAYRYFANLRVLEDSGKNVFLLQGHLTSALQHIVYFFIDQILEIPRNDLRDRFNSYGYGSNALVVFLNTILLLTIGYSKQYLPIDKISIGLVSVSPVLLTGHSGIYYSYLPDYYHLNMVIFSAAVAIFLWCCRANVMNNPYRIACLLGVFTGLAVANKVTLLVIAMLTTVPVLIELIRLRSWQTLALGSLVWASSALTTFLIVVGVFFLFDLKNMLWALKMIPEYSATVENTPDFIGALLSFSHIPHYKTAILFFGLCFIALCTTALCAVRKRSGSLRLIIILVAILVALVCYVWILAYRPADTTRFEASMMLFPFCAIALSLTHSSVMRAGIFFTWIVAIAWVAIPTLVSGHSYRWLAETRNGGNVAWMEFNRLQEKRDSIIFVVPNNEYFYTGVDPYETLLKGLSDAPTWNITTGRRYLDLLKSPIGFRTEHTADTPSAPYPDDAIILWYTHRDVIDLTTQYAALATIRATRSCSKVVMTEKVHMNVCEPR